MERKINAIEMVEKLFDLSPADRIKIASSMLGAYLMQDDSNASLKEAYQLIKEAKKS